MQRFAVPVFSTLSPAQRLLDALAAANRPTLWRADRCAATPSVQPSGHAALDAELPGGGWPRAGLTELTAAATGCGEWRLLAPLWSPTGVAGSVLCVAPPFTPYAPALRGLSLALPRLLIARTDSLADAAWAAEQGLRSGACAAVLWWVESNAASTADGVPSSTGASVASEKSDKSAGRRTRKAFASAAAVTTALRRLHLASLDAGCPLFALRPAAARQQSSPAPLRLAVEAAAFGMVAVTVFKRRGPAMAVPLLLSLPVGGLPIRRGMRQVQAPTSTPFPLPESPDAVVCAAPERIAA